MLAQFLATLGVAPGECPNTARLPTANARRGAKELEVRRRFWMATTGLGRKRALGLVQRLWALPAMLDGDARFAGFCASQARAVMRRFEASNARFAREYGIGDGALFQEPVADCVPARAAWADFAPRERARVCRYVRGRTGVDLAAPGDAVGGIAQALAVKARLDVLRFRLRAGHPARWWRVRGLGDQRVRREWLRKGLLGRWR